MRLARDFESIKKNAAKVDCSAFVFYFAHAESEDSRIAIITSRKVGCAVERNLVRRRVRAIFRETCADFPFPADILVFVRRGFLKFEYADILKKFNYGVSKGASILNKRSHKNNESGREK